MKNMKNIVLKSVVVTCAVALISVAASAETGACTPTLGCDGTNCVTTLIAGQEHVAGTVSITNSGWDMLVTVNAAEDWDFDLLHVYVGVDPVPTSNSGSVQPGLFPIETQFDYATVNALQTVSLAGLGLDPLAEDCVDTPLYVAVHADVIGPRPNGQGRMAETAWAFGDMEFEGDRWGWANCYQLACENATHDPECDPVYEDCDEGDTGDPVE